MSSYIKAWDVYRVRIPLVKPYHLSKVYGTITHSDVILLKIETSKGAIGWGEADPGGMKFTGDTPESVMESIRAGSLDSLKGVELEGWILSGKNQDREGSLSAACDVAIHDALARQKGIPVWELLGQKVRDEIDLLWPTSSGTAEEDLAVIEEYAAKGFNTYMLKMGDRPIADEITRVRDVLAGVPDGVRIMLDANQGWTQDEANQLFAASNDLPLILIEQPLAADDLEGLRKLRENYQLPVSVDESLQTPDSAKSVLENDAADIFSVKISKNGGLQPSLKIGKMVADKGKKVLMNSMIELGITQCASLHLGCVFKNLVNCGHAYMSTLRISDDVTNFSSWIERGTARLQDAPGLGINVDSAKIRKYLEDEYHDN
ncbi:MAG: hypothetical protein HOK24_13635 [Desulfobacula sp.]|jgi:muconate cycloisomerase|uniref:mandelate racemase/muconate lactonizing enzyme family protein n=1 Tax=Desulfobacula sp. TaxID=2593537 RepID=UPI001D320720|nr:hypothetical protein [Deltaproteobacteria bacterium]MBT3487018.1 hypothetical protein [Desulfobacula sp.]MBT4025868.1 hypothetical protein [Desulfobacula sp.]MBT4878095.1 hypothetical protein [Desulfobacula sp.]MBT5545502.1 hypothetical protein [Desulfobacula sp.]